MAASAIMDEYRAEEEGEAPERGATLDIATIIDPDTGNLAELLDESTVAGIGANVIRDVEIDERSRTESGWRDRYDNSLDIAMQTREAKTFPWPGASNVKYPLLTVSAIQFQARAYPAIVDGSNLVKGRVLGPDQDGTKRARAERIAAHMTWQLLYRMPGWEEDTDKLLLMLPIVGCAFRKSYYDPISATNRSDMVSAGDFIVNYWAKSLETTPRYTHVVRLYGYEALERIAAGLWLPVRVDQDDETGDDEDGLCLFYEQHRMIDLDGDGYPEPYVVTTNKEGQVARIVPCFGLDDVTVEDLASEKDEPIKLTAILGDEQRPDPERIGKVIRIVRRQYFTKYGFIPAPDGSFYDMGFGTLLYDISATIDTMLNQMVDAGALQNAQGGFLGSGVNIKGGDFRFRLGEWKRIDTTGGTLRDNVMPLAIPGPSPVLFQLLGLLIQAAKDITAVQDVLTGQGTANQPATTTLALIEQGQKVMTGIFKRIHRAFGDELRILRRLNRDYLDEQEYFQLNDGTDAQEVQRSDYMDDDLDVIPVSDPTAVSDMQKMAKAEASMVFRGDPKVNQDELYRRYFEAIGERDVKALLTPKQEPNPELIAAGAKLAIDKARADAEGDAKRGQAAKAFADAAAVLAPLGLIEDAGALAQAATEQTGQDDGQPTEPVDQSGGIGGMEAGPADGGLPALPEGAPDGLDGGMGEGGIPDAGTSGAGGPVGEAGGPVA